MNASHDNLPPGLAEPLNVMRELANIQDRVAKLKGVRREPHRRTGLSLREKKTSEQRDRNVQRARYAGVGLCRAVQNT